jgi:hypothetical protein
MDLRNVSFNVGNGERAATPRKGLMLAQEEAVKGLAHETHKNLIAHAHRVLLSLAAPALAPFLAEWPCTEKCRAVLPARLPVVRWLPAASGDAPRFSAALVAALCGAAPLLAWRQSYTAREAGADFLNNYGWSEMIGVHGPFASKRIACGFLLLAPSTLYPHHRHEAEEIYMPLAGTTAWQKGAHPWREQPPGTLIRHASEEPHAMQTGARPLLALYLWRSTNLSQKSRLDPPRHA